MTGRLPTPNDISNIIRIHKYSNALSIERNQRVGMRSTAECFVKNRALLAHINAGQCGADFQPPLGSAIRDAADDFLFPPPKYGGVPKMQQAEPWP